MSFKVGDMVRLLVNPYRKRRHEGDEGEVEQIDCRFALVNFGAQHDSSLELLGQLEKAKETSGGA